MLVCERCGCSGELGMGWLSVVRAEVVETQKTGWMVEYCPPCAAAVFGFRRPRDGALASEAVPRREG
jgi:hypothetical protein